MSEKKITNVERNKKNTKNLLYEYIEHHIKKVEDIPFDGIYVKLLSGEERRMFYAQWTKGESKGPNDPDMKAFPFLVTLAAVDVDGERIFELEDLDDVDKKIPSTIINKIFNAAVELNGLGPKSVDEAVKN